MFSPKEKAVSAIQRDRLAELLQVADINDTGCFYLALLMSWSHLYPNRVIDRKFAEDISRGKDRLVVSPQEVISEVKLREDQLGLRVTRIGITQHLDESLSDFKENSKIPTSVNVARVSYPIVMTPFSSSALVLWLSHSYMGVHYTSIHPSTRFSPEEIAPYHPDYFPATLFYLEPIS